MKEVSRDRDGIIGPRGKLGSHGYEEVYKGLGDADQGTLGVW